MPIIEEATPSSVIDDELKLFVLNSSGTFVEQVGTRLDIDPSPHEERECEDGELKARPLISVRGKNVFVVQSLYGDDRQSGNDKLCRLLFLYRRVEGRCRRYASPPSFLIWLMRGRIGRRSRAIR